MNEARVALIVVALTLLATAPAAAQPAQAVDFTGRWSTDYGVVVLDQNGNSVTGSYTYGAGGTVVGTVTGPRLDFRWIEPMAAGDAFFAMDADGEGFQGSWRSDGGDSWLPWNGRRLAAAREVVTGAAGPFTGLYETEWGRLRLRQGADGRVAGNYAGGGTIEGRVEGNRLVYEYRQTGSQGSGWFELSPDGRALTGTWQVAEGGASGPWTGLRIDPEPGVVWLVVLEAQWETSLAEEEYSFGDMLRAYFERLPQIRVRHRRLNDPTDFERAAEELALLAEPVALWLSGHGADGALTLEGGSLGVDPIAAAVAAADNVFLLHFSSCEMMVPGVTEAIRAAVGPGRDLVLSGYAVPVDWGASAVFEILYLDLVLGRGLPPRDAAAVLRSELNFADDTETSGSPLGALQFRMD